MWRPAIWRFGLVALAGCGGRGGAQGPQPIENHGGSSRSVAGGYACSIEDSGYRYPAFRCEIRQRGERMQLVKLDGSQRFDGEVREGRGGLVFDGRFFCPWGDCTQDLHGVFAPDGAGGWKGTFTDAKFVVWMAPAPGGTGAYGGAVYGGAAYGGQQYGGVGSGGGVPLELDN